MPPKADKAPSPRRGAACLFLAGLLAAPGPAVSQPQLTAHHEFQFGNLPGSEPRDLRTVYQQLNFGFETSGFLASLRSEAFRSSASGRDYFHLAQRSLSYRQGGFEAAAGTFLTLVGSGLLLHAFELPGVVTENRVSRRRYQIAQDLDGFQVGYRRGKVEVLLLTGRPVDSELAPGQKGPERRRGRVSGGAFSASPWTGLEFGTGVLDFDGEERGATTHARVRLGRLLKAIGLPDWYGDLYGEYARIDPALGSWFSLDREHARGLYLSSTFTGGAWGLSLEFKDYDGFNFPAVNNPPTLIREHEAFLLNRQTHTLLPDDETGFQAELTWALPHQVGLIAAWNLATRRGSRPGEEAKSLSEYFLQLDSPVGEALYGQVFFDYARTRILQNEKRMTAGTRWDWSAGSRYAIAADLQFQDVDRRFGSRPFPYENLLAAAEVSRFPNWSWSLQLQRSNDRLETGASQSGATWWWALGTSWLFRDAHTATLFAGKRRTGLACTGGTCYEVLGFEGLEFRLTSKVL